MADNSFTHLVVVGSSAGGIEALSGLVSSLPEDFDAPIVVAQHLDPKRESHLQEILARRSPLPVKTVTEHEPLQAGVVFVVPANRHVNITDSEIDLSSEPSSGQPMPSINILMETAAGVFGENLIAIVLSGTGTDGTEGARVVSQAGGTVVIQDPETAGFGEMPRSLAPSSVDIVSSLEGIGPLLKNLISGVAVPEEGSEDEARDLEQFLDDLHRSRGVDFRSYKRPMILRRISRRMAATDCGSIDEYSGYLEEHPEEYRQLINAFLIKVTEFFRDPELFDHLREEVLPGLIEEARQEENQLRIWSAGCATGEEAYSLAILVSDVLGREAGFFDARIFATDIDEDAIRFARRGVYPPSALKELSEEQKSRYFVEEGGSYQVKKQIRGMIVFGEHDLAQRSPFPNVDLVVSRNVLIYFSSELQRRALQLFAYALRDGGYLVMGKAESSSPLADFFAPVDRKSKVYRRQGQRFLLPPTFPKASKGTVPKVRLERSFGDRGVNQGQAETQQQLSAASRTAGEDLLNLLPLGIVVVARDYASEAINAAARRMLSIPGVGVGQDFLHAMQEAPYAEVRRTIDEAFKEGRTAQTEEFAVEEASTGEPSYLRLAEVEGQGVESVLVVVEDATAAVRMRRLSEKNLRLEAANQELAELNEELQAAHQESLVNSEEAQAAERERISRELHDRVAHSMGVAHQSLQLYEALAEKDPVRAQGRLHTAKEMIKTALEQTRNLSIELRRSETDNGLLPALQDLLEIAVPEDVSAELSTSGVESRLFDQQRGQLYLILREAVRNAVRHSGCRRLMVGLDVTSEMVSGFVEDDGRGFEDYGETEGGLGLRSVRERAALLEGTVELYSSPEGGAGVQVSFPLRNGVT